VNRDTSALGLGLRLGWGQGRRRETRETELLWAYHGAPSHTDLRSGMLEHLSNRGLQFTRTPVVTQRAQSCVRP
jgi:hypothetical protein